MADDPTLPGLTTGHACSELCNDERHAEHRTLPPTSPAGNYSRQAVQLRTEYAAAGIRLTVLVPLQPTFGQRPRRDAPTVWLVGWPRTEPPDRPPRRVATDPPSEPA